MSEDSGSSGVFSFESFQVEPGNLLLKIHFCHRDIKSTKERKVHGQFEAKEQRK